MGSTISVIISWLDFGDHPVASFRRSCSDSIAPIINIAKSRMIKKK
jgi:hypothetical protein